MVDAGSRVAVHKRAGSPARHTADGYVALQNDRLRTVTPNSVSERPITSADHLADTLETVFDLDIPRPGQVWDKIQAIGCDKAA
ncbi:hypothetical protein [Sinorhizobium fredii]|uniref:hypothetical protein n=1 Tax=Rhizobium fredii TaxID=380 RepID=UPI00351502BC